MNQACHNKPQDSASAPTEHFSGVVPICEMVLDGRAIHRLLMFHDGLLVDTTNPLDDNGDALKGEDLASYGAAFTKITEPR